jgi:hypothetical protein
MRKEATSIRASGGTTTAGDTRISAVGVGVGSF